MKKTTVLTVLVIAIIIILVTSLVLTAKYGYAGEIAHYKTNICYITNCTSILTKCCAINNIDFSSCSECYLVNITYDLYLANISNYTKTDYTTTVLRYYCDNRDILCYYDDRQILDSLRLFYEYIPAGEIIGMMTLSLSLFMMLAILAAIGCRYWLIN